jgi:hypothetical protein
MCNTIGITRMDNDNDEPEKATHQPNQRIQPYKDLTW